MKTIKTIHYDDWGGVYADGVLHYEGHSIDVYHLVQAADGEPITLEDIEVNERPWYAWLDEVGRLPEAFDDIPKEVYA